MTINKAQEIRFEKIVEKIRKKHFGDTDKVVENNLYTFKRTKYDAEITLKIVSFKKIMLSVCSNGILSIYYATWSITKDEINQYLTKLEEEIK
jgi:hypothetical protein